MDVSNTAGCGHATDEMWAGAGRAWGPGGGSYPRGAAARAGRVGTCHVGSAACCSRPAAVRDPADGLLRHGRRRVPSRLARGRPRRSGLRAGAVWCPGGAPGGGASLGGAPLDPAAAGALARVRARCAAWPLRPATLYRCGADPVIGLPACRSGRRRFGEAPCRPTRPSALRRRPCARPLSLRHRVPGAVGGLAPPRPAARQSSGTSSKATMLMILISGLMAGPAVSL